MPALDGGMPQEDEMPKRDLEDAVYGSFLFVVVFGCLAFIVGAFIYSIFGWGQVHCVTTTVIRGATTTSTKVCK